MVSYKALNTITESPISNICHGIRKRDGGEAAAFLESIISNTCNYVALFCSFVIYYLALI